MMNLFLLLLLITQSINAGVNQKANIKPNNTSTQTQQELPQCSICHEDIHIHDKKNPSLTLPCHTKHIFHKPCIVRWLDKKRSCPLCKKNIPDYKKQFLRAIEQSSPGEVLYCMQYIPDINKICNNSGTLALFMAAGHEADIDCIVELLLVDGKADPNICNQTGETPVHEAAYHDNPNVIRMLYQYGADVDKKTPTGDTALHFAASCGHVDAVDALVNDCHAKTYDRNSAGYTPIDLARKNKHRDVVELLKLAQDR